MTKEEILAMEAGVDLDAVVARDVMHLAYPMIDLNQAYSTDIWAAWQVVEKMITLGFEVTFNYCHTDKWSISFFDKSPEMFEGVGKEAPEAICKAALLAKMVIKNV